MPALLEVENLVKKYGDFTAVKGISFDDAGGRDLQPAGAERRRQDHHHLDALHPVRADRGRCAGGRAFDHQGADGGARS